MAGVFYFVKKSITAYCYPWYYSICREKKDEEIRIRRSKKGVDNIYKCFFYSVSYYLGWYVLKDSFIFPSYLGGSGSL